MNDAADKIVIAGSGVAGLSAAYRLQGNADVPFTVWERAPHVGGYSRTVRYKDFLFDLGGHRFYTKKAHVQKLVEDVVGDDLVTVNRISRIAFQNRFVDYPLNAFNTFLALGPVKSVRAALDYGLMRAGRLFSRRSPEVTFEQWALNRFGRYLYEIYFKIYTEKTWGVPCGEISADFAEQRIKGLSFREAVRDALFRKAHSSSSLIRQFVYPCRGFGMVPDALAAHVKAPNAVLTEHEVVGVEHDGSRITAVQARRRDGSLVQQPCSEFISSVAVDELVPMLRPQPPKDVLEAASQLRWRALVVVLLVLDVPQVSPDHWIYVPSQDVGFCRLHEPKNWSSEMAPADRTAVVLEYFCQQGDSVWKSNAEMLARNGARDLERLGLVEARHLIDWTAMRMPKAYPVYRLGYEEALQCINEYLGRFANLYPVGRTATFLYTSSDHYMDMGLKAAENVLGHAHDLSMIGREGGYAEA